MSSVTQRVQAITQPRGGYVPPRAMDMQQLDDGNPTPLDHKLENLHPSLVGTVVDYLTRMATGASSWDAFRVSLAGAYILGGTDLENATSWVEQVGAGGLLDTDSIALACQLSAYDTVARAGVSAYDPHRQLIPDALTCEHIEIMVRRAITVFDQYGGVTLDGFTFPGGYTDLVDRGDGDFLTDDTLWDMKVSVSGPKPKDTLQLLMYYLMGKRTGEVEFDGLTHIGVLNPRVNTTHRIKVSDIPQDVIDEVSRDVIGYQCGGAVGASQ